MAHESALRFEVKARCPRSGARLGVASTPHGTFETPTFMPVGTRATVKGVLPSLVKQTGAEVVLANTYHLLLRPGSALVSRRGGLHAFMGWPGPILTDSGGYQAYSMADLNSVDDDGVTFKSIVDGSSVRLTPEEAVKVQNELGADIIMAFDDCPPAKPVEDGEREASDPRLTRVLRRDRAESAEAHERRLDVANERTVRWLERCKKAHTRAADQALFGIIQGGTDLTRRSWSAERICGVELPGYAIGGVAVGESGDDIARVVRHTAPLMPQGKPRYLMGVGYERDIVAAVLAGVDMFDCVLPTRNGRNASAFTPTGSIRLRNAKHAEDDGPIWAGCDCVACDPAKHGWMTVGGRPFTRAYLRHLFMSEEMLGPILVTLHNLRHFQRLMADLRATIAASARIEPAAEESGQNPWHAFAARWPVAVPGLPAGLVAGPGGGRQG